MTKTCLAFVITLLTIISCGLLGGLVYFAFIERALCPKQENVTEHVTCAPDIQPTTVTQQIPDIKLIPEPESSPETSEETKCAENIPKYDSDNLCLTQDCTTTASTFISAMNTTLDPCEDFYEFGCSTFIKKHLVPEEAESFTTWEVFNTYFDLQMKEIIEKIDCTHEPNVVARVQEAYHVCINATHQGELELAAYRKYCMEIAQWPLASGKRWKPLYEDINDLVIHFISINAENPYFDISANPASESNLTEFQLTVEPKQFTAIYEEEDISEEDNRRKALNSNKATIDLIRDLAEILGNDNDAYISSDLQHMKIVSADAKKMRNEPATKLHKIDDHNSEAEKDADDDDDKHEDGANDDDEKNDKEHDDNEESEENSDQSDMSMTIQRLTSFCHYKIKWLDVFNKKIEKYGSHKLSKKDNVIVSKPKEMRILCKLIYDYPYRVLNNLYGFSKVFELGKHAGPLVDPIYQVYNSKQPPDKQEEPKKRWLYCLDLLQTAYATVLTRIFVNEYIEKSDKAAADEMIQLIQEAYKSMISKSRWVDAKTKKAALKKADGITRHVAYPDTIFDHKALDRLYSKIPNITSVHFNNVLLHGLAVEKIVETILSKDSWDFHPLMINAFYDPRSNSIWFPTGILQLPFFDSHRLAAVNFGMIGAIIGHEIGHAFDDSGSQFDEVGEFRNWWTEDTLEKFKKKTECFVNQYNDFCPEKLQGGDEPICVDGQNTLGENLADYTGIRAAFSAYKLWVEKHGPEKRLPGLQQFSPEQIFFIGFAYNWCENVPLDKWVDKYEYDPHSPGRYRVLGPLSNNEDFRKTFNCKEGKMNRGKNSCTVW